MQRLITGFHTDDEGDWVAELDCGHGQHTRHNPPFFERPWTETAEGRDSMLGQTLDCVRCDDLEFPEQFEAFHRTPEFTTATIPRGLLSTHTTKAGVWAKIRILEGRLRYRIVEPFEREFALDAARNGIVVPQAVHHVEPLGDVRFFVEFFRKPDTNESE